MTFWRSMDSAPRDGSIVELRCTYGRRPWYGRHRWTAEAMVPFKRCDSRGDILERGIAPSGRKSPVWASVDCQGNYLDDETHLSWRPIADPNAPYVDPTGGAQFTPGYWR